MVRYIVLITCKKPTGGMRTFIPSDGEKDRLSDAMFVAKVWASHGNAPSVHRVLLVDAAENNAVTIELTN